MKIRYKRKIGSHTVVNFIADAVVDAEATKAKIAPMVKPGMSEKEIEKLFLDNRVYCKVGPEADLVTDQAGEREREKLAESGANRLLLESGDYIADYRGTEYYLKDKSGTWGTAKIEDIGMEMPKNAVLERDITPVQREEINTQKEAVRIAALSPAERDQEERQKLLSLAREANQKAEDAELLGEEFDREEWFGARKTEMESIYSTGRASA